MGDEGTNETRPAFSPDGREIVSESDRHSSWPELYTMSSLDGSAMRRLTANSTWDIDADWQPIPECTVSGTGTITGTPGDDVICGSPGAHTINGDDIILTGGSGDALVGDPGKDQLNGGPGVDLAAYPGTTPVRASLATGLALKRC